MNTEDFFNTKVTFSSKSNLNLINAYLLFKIISKPYINQKISNFSKWVLKYKLPFKFVIRNTIYRQFCGGETRKKCNRIIRLLEKHRVKTILDYSIERKTNEKEYDDYTQILIQMAKTEKTFPFLVFKFTAIGDSLIFEKKNNKIELTEVEKQRYERAVNRFDQICFYCAKNKIPVLVDAEESWIQNTVDSIVEQMMIKYNQSNEAIVFNTIQAYRKDRLEYFKKLIAKSEKNMFRIGAKIVRGAYMEKERARAIKFNYADPICKNKKSTDINYDTIIDVAFQHLDSVSICAGMHNIESSKRLANKIIENNLDKKDNRIWFIQLFGMSDNITFALANAGFNVAKLLPYGPISETLPYLIRRANENTSIAGQTGRELTLIQKEIKRRKLFTLGI